MNRKFLVSTLFMAAAATLTAQQGAYQGTSNPPPDDTIIDNTPSQPAPAPIAKPPAAQYAAPAPMSAQPQQQQMAAPMQSAPVQPAIQPAQSPNDVTGTDDGIVQVAPDTSQIGRAHV